MSEQDSAERSAELLRLALPLMSKHADGFKPISYAVWYEYVAGSNDALRQEIDANIQNGARLSTAVTFDLYKRYMIDRVEMAVNNARSGLLDVLGKMQGTLVDANSRASGFNEDIESFSRSIASTDDRAELLANVGDMLERARSMSEAFDSIRANVSAGKQDIDRLTDELDRMRLEAQTDPLTSLMNRRGFDTALKAMMERAVQDHSELSLLMLDIDHFKRVNDSYGHLFGDQVIRGVAQAIKSLVKGRDIGARFGGEEFTVLLPNTGLDGAKVVASNIRALVERSKIRRNNSSEAIGNLTVSIGVATWHLGESGESLVDRADRALYEAKRSGRNRVCDCV
ncbi:MAG TPA: diguanylate cyclase [Burkholderiaceae bacterium]|nr:diguanylate cyclase [Burkholderiaceae bacterium]